jgi:DNA-binding beta-propeller fold protein YncE
MNTPLFTSRFAASALAAVLLFTACNPDKKEDPTPEVTTTNAVYVVNEGASHGTVSLFDKASKAVQRDLFEASNSGKRLGPVLQSMTMVGDNAYLVGNGSDTVQVVRLADFHATATITGLSQPRYLVAAGHR